MQQSDELFRLIKSMSKDEKRYFKIASKSAGSEKVYIELFDIINATDNYDETAIKAHLKVGNYRSLKYHLFKAIVESLKDIYYKKNSNNQLKEEVESAELLASRNLFDSSKKLIQKNIQLALDTENYAQFLNIITQQTEYDRVTSYKESSLEIIEQQKKAVDEAIEKIKLFHHLQQQTRLIDYLFFKTLPFDGISFFSEIQIKEIEEKYSDSFLILDTLYVYIYSYHHCVKKDLNTANRYTSKSFNVIEKLKLTERYPERYLNLLYQEGLYQLDNKEYKVVEGIFKKMEGLKFSVLYLKTRQQFYHLSLSLRYFKNTSQFEKGMFLIKGVDISSIKNATELGVAKKKHIYWKIAEMCFYSEDYKRCKTYVNYILELDEDVENREILKTAAALGDFLKIIIAYEEGDWDFVKYQSKRLVNNLEKKQMLFSLEKTMLLFFQNTATKTATKKENTVVFFNELKQKIEAIPKQELFKGLSIGFDFMAWVNSKIQGVKLQAFLKNQFAEEK